MTTVHQIPAAETNAELIAAREEISKLKAMLLFSQRELLQFSHVANHDLQEPLRKIQVYSGMLRDRGMIAEPDRAIVEKILSSSNRVSLLISDILEHSKVISTGKMFRPVNLNAAVSQIISDFELAIEERGAVVNIDPLPVVNAVALEMNQLFYNLVDNALKFSDSSRTPEISIRCKKLEGPNILQYISVPKNGKTYFDISVRDNGIGLDVKYAEQIFTAFKRLHPKDVYPGSGIGLSLCRNILANHGGVLFVESQPGEGSAFHIIIQA